MATAELTRVSMWYDQRGAGDPCVLLHPGGAGVDTRALGPTVDGLSAAFRVFTPEQRGHGRTPAARSATRPWPPTPPSSSRPWPAAARCSWPVSATARWWH